MRDSQLDNVPFFQALAVLETIGRALAFRLRNMVFGSRLWQGHFAYPPASRRPYGRTLTDG